MRLFILVLAVGLLLLLPAAHGESNTLSNTSVNQYAGNVSLIPDTTDIFIPSEKYHYENITLTQTGNYPLAFTLNKTGQAANWTKFMDNGNPVDQTNLSTTAFGSNVTTIRIFVPFGQEGAWILTLNTYGMNDSKANSTNITLTVNDTNPIDDVSVTVLTPQINSGDSLTINVSILKISPNATLDVLIGYCITPVITNADCTVSTADETETRAITTWLNFTKNISNVIGLPGNYFVKVIIEYKPNEVIPSRAKASDQFTILGATTPPSSSGGGGGGGGSGGSLPQNIYDIEIVDLPSYYKIYGEVTETFLVKVRNSGASVNNVSLSIKGIPIEWYSISPLIVPKIPSGGEAVFLVSLKTPSGLSKTFYTMIFTASAKETETTEFMDLEILEELPEPEMPEKICQEEAAQLLEVIDELWREATSMILEGNDAGGILTLLAIEKNELSIINSRLAGGNYPECSADIQKIRKDLERIVESMAALESGGAACPLMPLSILGICAYWWLIVIALVAIIAYLLIRFKHRKMNKDLHRIKGIVKPEEKKPEKKKRNQGKRTTNHP